MHLNSPSWWYGDGPKWAARLLWPIAEVWARSAERRYRQTRTHRSALPVICVGNFTAGGAGKTPVAIAIGKHLKALGHMPAFLSRGFGGTNPGPHFVDLRHDTASAVGDEPLLLAAHAPTMIARDRIKGATAIEKTDADVIIMDDGLQNPALAKTLSLAVVDAERGIGNGDVIPAGPLRARLPFQLQLTDAIIVMQGEESKLEASAYTAATKAFSGPILYARLASTGDISWLLDRPCLAYSGIAHPEKFFASLRSCGADVIDTVGFPDHHMFTDSDARSLLQSAEQAKAQLVTTEKDLVRLATDFGDGATLRARSRAVPVEVSFADTSQDLFASLMRGVFEPATC